MRTAAMVSTVVGLALLLLAGCGGSSSDSARSVPTVPRPTLPPAPPVGADGAPSFADPAPDRAADRFVRRLGVRCRRLERRIGTVSSDPGSSLQEVIEAELPRLRRLQRLLGSERPPRSLRKDLRRYTAALAAQIYLDTRIITAIENDDSWSKEIGLRQNQFNRKRRNALATELGLPRCFRDRQP